MNFFAVKVDGSDVIAGICKEVFIQRDSRYDITSVNFNSEKVHEDDIFVYITISLRRIQRLQIFKIPIDVIRTLKRGTVVRVAQSCIVRCSLCNLYKWRYKKLGDLQHVRQWPEYCTANPGFFFDFQLVNVEDFNGVGESEPNPYFYQVHCQKQLRNGSWSGMLHRVMDAGAPYYRTCKNIRFDCILCSNVKIELFMISSRWLFILQQISIVYTK